MCRFLNEDLDKGYWMKVNFAIVIPMANESKDFIKFTDALAKAICNPNYQVKIYCVVDLASKDNTLALCNELSIADKRFVTIWAPENKNIVDAYIRGYKEALQNKHNFIIEMDAGMSHDPSAIPMFLRVLQEGNECAFGSRFINGGSIFQSNLKRTLLSKVGTILSNVLLGTKLHDATSGYQGFHAAIVEKFLAYKLLSTAHFYQTELRYLLRKTRFMEVPIHYRAPSPSVSKKAIYNSFAVLFHYLLLRLRSQSAVIE